MPDRLTDAREWTLRCENYVWHAKPNGAVPIVKDSVEFVVVPKVAALPREDEGLREAARRLHDAFIRSDRSHPDGAAYRLVNLREALDVVPDTGDWHAEVRSLLDWLIAQQPEELRNRPPNQTADEQKSRLAASPVASREANGHIEWWDDPNADVEGAKGFNRRYFQHVGCDEGNAPWVVPKDDCPPPKGTRECARCDLVLPLLEKASEDG